MKKLIFSLLTFLFITSNSFAQGKLKPPPISFHLAAGYGLGLPGYIAYDETFRDPRSDKSVPIRTAEGIQVSAAVGIGLKNGFRFLVQAHYQQSLGQTTTQYISYTEGGVNVLDEIPSKIDYQTLAISPLIHYQVKLENSKWQPFISLGPSLMVQGRKRVITEGYDPTPGLQYDYVLEEHTRMDLSFGGRVSIGFERQIAPKLFLSASLQFRAAYLVPKISEYVRVELDGEDVTNQFETRQLQVEYVDNYEYDWTPRPSEPSRSPKISEGYFGYDLMLGLSYYLFE